MYIVRNDQIAILYGTDDCHLCEHAQMALTDAGISFNYIDIAFSEALITEFGTKIPVILLRAFTLTGLLALWKTQDRNILSNLTTPKIFEDDWV